MLNFRKIHSEESFRGFSKRSVLFKIHNSHIHQLRSERKVRIARSLSNFSMEKRSLSRQLFYEEKPHKSWRAQASFSSIEKPENILTFFYRKVGEGESMKKRKASLRNYSMKKSSCSPIFPWIKDWLAFVNVCEAFFLEKLPRKATFSS